MPKEVFGTGVVIKIGLVFHIEADQDLADQGKEEDHIHRWTTLEHRWITLNKAVNIKKQPESYKQIWESHGMQFL